MEKHSNARGVCRPRHFNKRALTAIELIAKLRRQGMVVNVDSALPYLQQIGAFRMKGYWYPWQDKVAKTFKSGACFDDAIRRYEFDRELRRITASALESIEIMVRTVFSEVMVQGGGPHWFLKASVFGPAARGVSLTQRSFLQKIEVEVARMQDKAFIAHYKQTYDSPALPPSWVISECLSFGAWSHAYMTLADRACRIGICKRFKVEDDHVFASWLHALSVLRNVVAHHGRLLGAQSSVTPKSYRKRGLSFDGSRSFFVMACVIHYVCSSIRQGPDWTTEIGALFERYPDLDKYALLGFPQDWFSQPLWLCGQRRRG